MGKESLVNYIQQILPMPVDKAEYITTFFTQKYYSKNTFLLKEGQICIESHFIESGFLRSYVVDIDGNEVTTDFYGSNNFANDFLSFFKRVPSNENIQVLADCTTWMINYEDLQICFHSIPEFREFGRMMLINNYSRLKERMFGMIQLTAEQRYERLVSSHAEIFQNASLKYIASYLGITDTSLSRIRKDITRSR